MSPDEHEAKPQPEELSSKDEKQPAEQKSEDVEHSDHPETEALKAKDTPPAAMESAPEDAKTADLKPTPEAEPLPPTADESRIAGPGLFRKAARRTQRDIETILRGASSRCG